jgi:hypothetical protein
MLPTFHDNFLVSYEVNCEMRRIRLRTRPELARDSSTDCTIEFSGVEGYNFKNDAFGNIVFALTEVSVDKILVDHGSEIEESNRMAGAPGRWADDLKAASAMLGGQGIRGFELSSSYGLSGWVLAKEAAVWNLSDDSA